MAFHFNSWLVYFYFYCICGWVFESTYVSLKNKKWMNRGFMKGPWLPLYGSGAISILLATRPFWDNPLAVYVIGALAATALEYVTGVLMLKFFKVRYWDYRYRKIQFQGHICLVSSITWGFFSLLMVYVIHKPVAKLVAGWNEEVVSIATFLVTVGMVYDFANAFREAMDLRALIIQAEELKKRLEETLEQQREKLSESVEETREQIEQRVEETKEQLTQRMEETREQWEQAAAERKEQREQIATERREQWEQVAAERKEQREQIATERREQWEQAVADRREHRINEWEDSQSRRREQYQETLREIEQAREQLRQKMEQHSRQLLLHNPGSGFNGLEEETKEIKRRLLERKK
jgi:uncharacterized membrane protein